jgi:hypothetical protein
MFRGPRALGWRSIELSRKTNLAFVNTRKKCWSDKNDMLSEMLLVVDPGMGKPMTVGKRLRASWGRDR